MSDTTLNIGDGIKVGQYSESEIIVGTWIDDKPIYRKVIQGITIANHSSWYELLTISNLNKVINIWAIKNNGEVIIPRYESSEYNANFLVDGTVIKYKAQGQSGTFDLIVEYTKTTN